jgi:hypothetical protein
VARGQLSAPAVRRGEIWLAQLDKRRPVVVLTRDPLMGVWDQEMPVDKLLK